MKINALNKCYLGFSLLLILVGIYRTVTYKSWERYYYDATSIAPEDYPVHIIDTYFLTDDEDDFAFIKDESVNRQITNWYSDGDFLELREKMRLPKKLVISYVSYRDNLFYKDTLQLPTPQIEKIFKLAEKNKSTEKYYSYRDDLRGLSFVLGVANNGKILVWLRGINLEELILKTQLTPKEPKGDDLYYEQPLSKKAYFEHAFENISDSLKNVYKVNVGRVENYADTPTKYIERNAALWKYQRAKGIIN